MVIERLSRLSGRQQAICASIALVLCGYACYAGIVEPQLMELHAVRGKLKAQRQLLLAKRQRAAEQTVEERRRDRLREELHRADSQFFSRSQSWDFFAALDALAKSTNCQLGAMDFLSVEEPIQRTKQEDAAQLPTETGEKEGGRSDGAAEKTRRPVKIRARVSLVGIYPDVITVLEAIEARPQMIHIGQVTLALVSEHAPELNASFVLSVFALERKDSDEL